MKFNPKTWYTSEMVKDNGKVVAIQYKLDIDYLLYLFGNGEM